MKHKIQTALMMVILSATAVILLAGCDLLGLSGITIDSRLDAFIGDLNREDRSGLYEHFHPDTLNRQQIADNAVFLTGPLSYEYARYSLSSREERRLSDQQTEVSAFLGSDNGNYPIVFVMERDGIDWYIRVLTYSVGDNNYEIRKLTP